MTLMGEEWMTLMGEVVDGEERRRRVDGEELMGRKKEVNDVNGEESSG